MILRIFLWLIVNKPGSQFAYLPGPTPLTQSFFLDKRNISEELVAIIVLVPTDRDFFLCNFSGGLCVTNSERKVNLLKTSRKIRLIKTPYSSPPIGTIGMLTQYKHTSTYLIIWATGDTQIINPEYQIDIDSGLISDEFQFDYIIPGYQCLTMYDVLSITFNKNGVWDVVPNRRMLGWVYKEYEAYFEPFVKRRLLEA